MHERVCVCARVFVWVFVRARERERGCVCVCMSVCVCVTWNSGVCPCRWAGLRAPRGLRLPRKWSPERSGLWANNRPEEVWRRERERGREGERERD